MGRDVREMKIAERALDPETVTPQRLEMATAGDEVDVGARGHEATAEISADGAARHDRNPHETVPQAADCTWRDGYYSLTRTALVSWRFATMGPVSARYSFMCSVAMWRSNAA